MKYILVLLLLAGCAPAPAPKPIPPTVDAAAATCPAVCDHLHTLGCKAGANPNKCVTVCANLTGLSAWNRQACLAATSCGECK